MSDVVLDIQNLSKCYRVGARQPFQRSFREMIVDGFTAPLANLRRLRALTRFDGVSEGESDGATVDSTTGIGGILWALKDICLQVRRGEVLGVIGRNGAGKSTLLKILSRITRPTSGQAVLRGRVSSLLEVGTGFHPDLTGRENIYLNGTILGMSRAEIGRRFDEIVDFSGVERFLDTPVKRYSSGMYVRLAFAVAAHLDPEILLVDEILSVGDLEFQEKCLGRMRRAGESGRTVIIVSHNMPSVLSLCHRAILLDGGRVAADGDAFKVVADYRTAIFGREGQVTWEDARGGPAGRTARLRTVRVQQEGADGPAADLVISRPIDICIEYENFEEGAKLYAGLWLRNKEGVDVLASMNSVGASITPDPWYAVPHPRGCFQSVCRIPSNFLNNGLYMVTPIIGVAPNRTIAIEENALSFNVLDTGEMRLDGDYNEWLGVVRPRLDWQTEQLAPSPAKSREA